MYLGQTKATNSFMEFAQSIVLFHKRACVGITTKKSSFCDVFVKVSGLTIELLLKVLQVTFVAEVGRPIPVSLIAGSIKRKQVSDPQGSRRSCKY